MVPLRITRSNLDSASIPDVGNREKPTAADAPVVMNCRRERLAGMAVLLSRMIQVPGSPQREVQRQRQIPRPQLFRFFSRDRVEQAPRQESAFAIDIAIGIGIERTGWSGIHR